MGAGLGGRSPWAAGQVELPGVAREEVDEEKVIDKFGNGVLEARAFRIEVEPELDEAEVEIE